MQDDQMDYQDYVVDKKIGVKMSNKLNEPKVQRLNIKIKPKEKIYLIYGDGQLYHLHNLIKGSKYVVITIRSLK